MSENQHETSDFQEQESKPEYARPIIPFYFERLGLRPNSVLSSSFNKAGPGGEVWVFIILFVILVSALIGAATKSLLIGIISFVVIIALAICINVLLTKLRSTNRGTDTTDQL